MNKTGIRGPQDTILIVSRTNTQEKRIPPNIERAYPGGGVRGTKQN